MQIKKTTLKTHEISTAKIFDFYETMVFCKKIKDDVKSSRTKDRREALKNHDAMILQYGPDPAALAIAETLKAANEAAKIHLNDDDGGTCNFDAPVLFLKGKNKNFIHQIEAAAGIELSKMDSYGRYWSGGYFVGTISNGQGARRTKMAEAAARIMAAAGLECTVFYQMD